MEVIILAGGKGSRLYPLTIYMPKQLIMLNGYPLINYVLSHCKKNDINDIILCISDNHFKNHFFNALGRGENLGVSIKYSVGPESLGTAGRIRHAREMITGDSFLVYYGDIIANFSLKNMINTHEKLQQSKDCICTLAMSSSIPLAFGVAMVGEKDKGLRIYKEKPIISEVTNYKVNVGISVCSTRLIDHCSDDADLFDDVVTTLVQKGEYVHAYDIRDTFYDVGTLSSLEDVMKILGKK